MFQTRSVNFYSNAYYFRVRERFKENLIKKSIKFQDVFPKTILYITLKDFALKKKSKESKTKHAYVFDNI